MPYQIPTGALVSGSPQETRLTAENAADTRLIVCPGRLRLWSPINQRECHPVIAANDGKASAPMPAPGLLASGLHHSGTVGKAFTWNERL